MVPAWPQVLSQVLSQPCPKSWPNPVPMSLFPVLSPWPGQGSIRQVQVDKTVWPMSQLGICTSPDSSSLEGPGRKKWHNTLIFGP